jgi:hypothetical protein
MDCGRLVWVLERLECVLERLLMAIEQAYTGEPTARAML